MLRVTSKRNVSFPTTVAKGVTDIVKRAFHGLEHGWNQANHLCIENSLPTIKNPRINKPSYGISAQAAFYGHLIKCSEQYDDDHGNYLGD
jgi:hypothetical protein